ncbi:hypothetical protein RB614_24295 [Phytohabitans sp. ZYX-F-186]|uniref:Gamma-glutamylcyclotransferase AIG2-like domain-containing protein n=1 Tax=Phytohabitans maris TaxID=3071409 RepID=A0ABU0ZKS0_9ACTN|nr:hypothetical protein [Phytohabitans sp. ZYX-F-186]MDQ7907647.1 hypothetical protein [Phytohabitans sp. ZYX-F-186]
MSVRTYTWTQTRLETVQDQFRYLLVYGSVDESKADKLLLGIHRQEFEAVGIFGTNASGQRVVEVELEVDWERHGLLTLSVPTLVGELPGWQERQAPEIRVAGRRFAEVVKLLELTTSFWVRFVPQVTEDPALHEQRCVFYGLGFRSGVPEWESTPEERTETFLDLGELDVTIRRASNP